MAGRPKVREDLAKLTTMTSDDADYVFSQIADGELLYRIAAEFQVGRTALMEWIEASPDRVDRYKRACVSKAAAYVDQTIGIADNGADASAPDPARDKLRIQARQWTAARLDRATWGESRGPSVEVNIGGMFLNAMRQRTQVVDTQQVAELPASVVSDDAVTHPLG